MDLVLDLDPWSAPSILADVDSVLHLCAVRVTATVSVREGDGLTLGARVGRMTFRRRRADLADPEVRRRVAESFLATFFDDAGISLVRAKLTAPLLPDP